MSTLLVTFGLTIIIGGLLLFAAWLAFPEQTGRVLDWGVDAAHVAAPHKGTHVPPLGERLAATLRHLPKLRACVSADFAHPDGPAPEAPSEGAGSLYAKPGDLPPLLYFRHDGVIEVTDDKLTIRPSTDATGGASPYPALTEPLAALSPARPFVVIAEKYMP